MSEIRSGLSQAYNLVWMSPRFPEFFKGADGMFYQPIPDKTAENMLMIAKKNPTADVRLWVDSRRLTAPQIRWLEQQVGEATANMSVQDLRTIPEYDRESLYNRPDKSPIWRADKHSLIWRQVDSARILASLQGNYDQVFYSDADVTNLYVASSEIQTIMAKHGLVVAGGVSPSLISNGEYVWYENQMFGFNQSRRSFFTDLYERTLRDVQRDHQNGFRSYVDLINSELKTKMGIDTKEIVFRCEHDGTEARHPGEPIHQAKGLTTNDLLLIKGKQYLISSTIDPNIIMDKFEF